MHGYPPCHATADGTRYCWPGYHCRCQARVMLLLDRRPLTRRKQEVNKPGRLARLARIILANSLTSSTPLILSKGRASVETKLSRPTNLRRALDVQGGRLKTAPVAH